MKINFNPKESTRLKNTCIVEKTPVFLEDVIVGYVDSVSPDLVTCEIFDSCITYKLNMVNMKEAAGISITSPFACSKRG